MSFSQIFSMQQQQQQQQQQQGAADISFSISQHVNTLPTLTSPHVNTLSASIPSAPQLNSHAPRNHKPLTPIEEQARVYYICPRPSCLHENWTLTSTEHKVPKLEDSCCSWVSLREMCEGHDVPFALQEPREPGHGQEEEHKNGGNGDCIGESGSGSRSEDDSGDEDDEVMQCVSFLDG